MWSTAKKYTKDRFNHQFQVINDQSDTLSFLKRGVWVYLFLLFFEGALRKWIVPSLSGPLLIIRDPVAALLIFHAIKHGIMPKTIYVFYTAVVSLVSFVTALLLGHGSIAVALYGLRIAFIHFPFMFLIGKVLIIEDILKVGKVMMWIAIPMTILMILQFYSPQSAWVNRGIGGDMEGGGFSGAMGYFRPPTTFSFINGTVAFYSLLYCYVAYFWISSSQINKLLLLIATFCVVIAIPFSISRTLFFQVLITSFFAFLYIAKKPKGLIMISGATLVITIAFFIMSNLSFFQNSILVFSNRFESANTAEGGLEGVFIDRFLGGMYGALFQGGDLPYFGYGLGMGTNVGARLLTGEVSFLIAEGEWGRLIGEQGALLGLAMIFIRSQLGVKLLTLSFRAINNGGILSWLLLSFGFLKLLQGQWSQPTDLGFAIITVGFVIATLKK